MLCKSANETKSHLLCIYPYEGHVWEKVARILNQAYKAILELTLEQSIKKWWTDEGVHNYESFLALFVFTIWEARNRVVFQNNWTPPEITEIVLMQKVMEHRNMTKSTPLRTIIAPEINQTIPKGHLRDLDKEIHL